MPILKLKILMTLAIWQLFAVVAVTAADVSYQKDVWPIFKRQCWGCHFGAEAKGDLRLGTAKQLQQGGESGPLFTPGDPDDSLLIQYVSGDEPEMPPKPPGLSGAEIETLRQWITAGAKIDSTAGANGPAVVIPEEYRSPPAITSISFHPNGKQVAAACRSEVVLLDIEGDTPPVRLPTESDLLTHVEFDAQGKILVAAGGTPGRFGEVRFFAAEEYKLLSSRRVSYDTLFRGSFAPDGAAVALGGADGAIYIVPVDEKTEVRRAELHSDWVMDVAYTPDGKMLVSGGRDKTTKVSSLETLELLRSVDSSTDLITSVTADAGFAVAAGRARTLTGYELKIALQNIQVTGSGNGAKPISRRNQYAKAFESQPGEVLNIATSGDRTSIALAGRFGEIRVYKISDRSRVAAVPGVSAPVYSVALNQDATRLAAGGKDGQLKIYEIPSGKLIKTIKPVPVEGDSQEGSVTAAP